jgi:uncharacterized protein
MGIHYENLEKLATDREDENWDFRQFLKFHLPFSDKKLDNLVYQIGDRITSATDCTRCSRCCQQVNPILSPGDQQRLAKRLGLSPKQLQEKYLVFQEVKGESAWKIKDLPCPFLQDSRCSVYEDRPQNCRDYPYLHQPDFSSRTIGMIDRTFTCPIVFQTMEELKQSLHFKPKSSKTRRR